MRVVCNTVTSAAVYLDGELLKRCGGKESSLVKDSASSSASVPVSASPLDTQCHILLVQVWFAEDGSDTLDDAAYAGRYAIAEKYWPSKSRKRRKPRARNARDVKAEVLFVIHRRTAAVTHSASANSGTEKSAEQIAVPGAAEGAEIEPLEFRRLFREVVFRAQVEYSSDKVLRGQRVSGVVVQDRHRLTFELDRLAVEDVMDTRESNVARKKRPRKKKRSSYESLPSSSSKVLARSTPLDLSSSSLTNGPLAASRSSALVVPAVEQEHVHKVYDSIADHWDGTRYAPWPRVVEFIQSLPPSSLVADVGCGNGKYMQPTYIGRPVALGRAFVGCDMSANLISICAKRGFNALVCDGLLLPYRDGSFDAALSIAVFHHISTRKRRIRALQELSRIVRTGGPVLIYAWAQEQQEDSRRRFESQDVLVPWHLKKKKTEAKAEEDKQLENINGKRQNKRAKIHSDLATKTYPTADDSRHKDQNHEVFQRYCHVYKKGDLESLVKEVPSLKIVKTYFDCSNWAIIAERL